MSYVALIYAHNSCYTQVTDLGAVGVTVVAERWWNRPALTADPLTPINTVRHIPVGQRYGIIGVFDTTLPGLNSMCHAACAATADDSCQD